MYKLLIPCTLCLEERHLILNAEASQEILKEVYDLGQTEIVALVEEKGTKTPKGK